VRKTTNNRSRNGQRHYRELPEHYGYNMLDTSATEIVLKYSKTSKTKNGVDKQKTKATKFTFQMISSTLAEYM
jgi:hypothetical protein